MQKIISRFLMSLAIVIACGFIASAETLTPRSGVIRVKLQDQVATKVGATNRVATKGVLSTGVQTLDVAAKKVKATSIRRVFPYSPLHEAKMAEYGLDRWYEVSFDESISPLEAKAIFGQTAGVQVATCRVPMVLNENGTFKTVSSLSTDVRPSTMPFNDPRLPSQWHYNNNGSLAGSITGADINLFKAWETCTGNNNTIVAIIDGGIDYTHEDLATNVYINQAELNGQPGVDDDGNGYADDVYGWNFCTNSKDIYPHSHGTHVAGTVAAVNNNGIGVCGIAGGNGTADSGVKMLSCQVFDSRSGSGEGDFAAAIVYAANNGASIANCSWGWASDGYYEQDVLDAIDYFVAQNSSTRLNGGIMFFATGNEGVTGDFYPACYDKVVAVGSMTSDYTVAPYSNYGAWVDIVAPGGLLDYGDAGGVLSTLPNNQYGYSEGTSMATPHVTGIAALVVSYYGNATMPASTIRQQIITSVNDLYKYNAGKEGLHGAGYIDAVKALQMSGSGTAPSPVTSFTALPAQDNITIGWIIPNSEDNNVNYHALYYSTEEFDATSDLSKISNVSIDTKFLNSGDSTSYELTGLQPLTTYYLAMKAVNRWGDASELSPVVMVTTNAGPKMTVSKTSLSFTVKPDSKGTATFNIGNEDEGLLKWSTSVATTQATISTRGLNKPEPGVVSAYNGKLGVTPYAANEVFKTTDFLAGDYPKEFKYYSMLYASIGDSDTSLPNSMAQWFYVDADQYPEGFNLTGVKVTSFYGSNPIFQIYKGSNITNATLLQEFTPSAFYSDGIMKPSEQVYFAPGESFWIVVHFPAGQEGYPLGLALVEDEAYSGYSYMSNDMGKTWSTMSEALRGSSYESMSYLTGWAITAVSQNPAWDKIITITPSNGQVKYGETQSVEVTTDGQPLVNGTYKFNIRFNTNESQQNTTVIPVSLTVSGNAPKMVPAKVVNFGSLLVGESKTLTVEVFNEGYGVFGYYGSLSGNRISSTSEHFKAPTSISGGFPARAYKTFDVEYTPKSAGSHTGNIVFTHSDGTKYSITVTGVATDPAKIIIEPDTIECDTINVTDAPVTKEFVIKNEGNYPLEYVFPKFSDQQLEKQGKAAHKFGYVELTNINGSTAFAYDGNPALIGGTEITSQFNDNTYLSNAIDLGFEFPFYGKKYSQMYITSYGGIAFNEGENVYRAPLAESSYSLDGIAYISAYGYQLALGPSSKIEYAKQDGKMVINFSNVLGLVYDQDYTPISFRIALTSNGDIEIFYDSYNPTELFQGGSTLYCGIHDPEDADPLTITSADVADYWDTNDDPAGDVYKYFATTSSVKFVAPKPNFITALSPAYGIVNPGEGVTIAATLQANDANIVAGDTYNRLVVMSNDAQNGVSYVQFNATIVGDELLPVAQLASNEIDFGKVFRTSVAQKAVTVKNTGKSAFDVTNVSVSSGLYNAEAEVPFTIEPGMSKDIIVTLPTENEGAVLDNICVYTSVGELWATLKGEVVGCPTIDLSYSEITETLVSGTELVKPLTIANNGNETLVYSITPNPEFVSFSDAATEGSKVSYSYASSSDDKAVKFNWIDIETTGLGEQNNFSYYNSHDFIAVELPFAFPYYGKEYTKMYIYNTGFVSFTEREDQKIWPEPPAEFPSGTIYTNIIAPYWGLHTMDTSKTGGTYHYMTEEEVIVSWMEYGNTMNMGVCYQLIMKKDGSFKFQYKGYGDYAVIFGIFGLAGLSNEDGSEGMRIPERYVAFNNAVQFFPIVESSIAAGESKTIDINVLTDKMAGEFNTNLVVNSNVPSKEKIELPINLTIIGEAKPVFPDTIIVENVMGMAKDEYKGPLTQMGAFYEAYFKIENKGTASFTINNIINEGSFTIYDSWFDEYYTQPAYTYCNMEVEDWMTGEMMKTWTQYYDGTPVVVDSEGFEISIPIMYGTIESTPGTYDIPLTIIYNETETAKILVRFIVTNAPYLVTDKSEIYVENATNDYVGNESVIIANYGQYKLTYDLRLDPTGKGEEIPESDMGGGIAPMDITALSSYEQAELYMNLRSNVTPLEVSSDKLNAYDSPADFDYNRVLYYPSNATSATYTYGAGNTYSEYKAATYYVAPTDGFNISHVYIATTLTNADGSKIKNADYTVEIVNGDDYENGTVLGKGKYHIDEMDGAKFVIVPLERSVYMNPGQDFYVRVSYPVGIEYPAYLSIKEESVVSNRYMGYVENYGWFDIASMFKDQIGSCGYIMSCLETTTGAPWVKVLNAESEMSGVLEPGESLEVKFELSAADAPLDKGNKAVLVVKSNDTFNPILNLPIILDRNAAPEISVPAEIIYAKEAETTRVEVVVNDVENDDFTIRLDDSGSMSKIQGATAINGSNAEVTVDGNNVTVKNATEGVKVIIGITPEYETAGEYTLTVVATDANGNEKQETVNYVVEHTNRAPEASTIASISIAQGSSSQVIKFADCFTDPDGDEMMYSMMFTDENIVTAYTTESGVIFYGENVGTVYVAIIATDVNGAQAATYFEVTVTEVSGIENISINAEVGVYPNPVVETLYVTCDFNSLDVNYTIYSENGAVVYSSTCEAVQGEAKTINVSNLVNGLYILKVTANGGVATYPIVKQ